MTRRHPFRVMRLRPSRLQARFRGERHASSPSCCELDLIPMVGATLGAVAVGVVVLFAGSTVDVIMWAIFAIVYQQFESYVVQPRIQSKAVSIDPFIVVIAALVGGALLGVVGALLAIPGAATIQISLKEYLEYSRAKRLPASRAA
jgi:predicted PurR-regulated permease PerM